MQQKSKARALLAGPISKPGHQHLALVILALTGPDGWAVVTGKQLIKVARLGKSSGYDKLNEMEKMGLVEWRKASPQAIRVVQNPALEYQNSVLEYQIPALQTGEAEYQNPALEYQNPVLECQNLDSPNPSAYLPKRYKDKKEVEEKDPSPSSSPGAEPMVIAGKQAEPISTAPNQPAAQPPAVVEQGAQLPAKRKAKRKTPRKHPPHRIPEGWEPEPETLDKLEQKGGIPRAFTEALVWEFVIYWTGNGEARPGWDATFIRHAKNQWKREQENEQRAQANQKYRDRSGKPISEASYLSRENARQVIADLEAGVLNDFDLDAPV